MLFASAAPLLAGHQAIDRDCAPVLTETHDHAAHRLTPASAREADHCGVCHLARSARAAALPRTVLPTEPARDAIVANAADARTRSPLQTDFTRGPPR